MGERGLKLYWVCTRSGIILSLPMGERGLKPVRVLRGVRRGQVAPYGGAWIETYDVQVTPEGTEVAPYGGAWIET